MYFCPGRGNMRALRTCVAIVGSPSWVKVKQDSTFTHDGDPTIATHVRNARMLPRPGQKYILGKPSQTQKIDGVMASVLANECAGDVTSTGSWPKPVSNMIYTASSTRWR